MTTKEKIIEEALTLFSTRGYDGVSVKDIANAVHIKDSSLYKHFRSKQEIFDTIVEEMSARIEAMSVSFRLPDANKEDISSRYGRITVEELVELSKQVFLFYWADPFASRYRRMLSMEQYRSVEIARSYRKFYMEDSVEYISMVFHQLIQAGEFIDADPSVMAMNFYAPMFLLMNRYDDQPERKEEAFLILEKQVREFERVYRK